MNGGRRIVRIAAGSGQSGLDRGVIGAIVRFQAGPSPRIGAGSDPSTCVSSYNCSERSRNQAADPRIGAVLACAASCVNNCSEEEALLPPGSGCAAPAPEQLFGPEAAGQAVLAAESLRTIVRAGCLEGCTKKKSRKTKTCSFSFINHNITKDYHVAIYIVIVANVVKIKKINLAVDSTCNDCYIYTILNKQKDKANEVY